MARRLSVSPVGAGPTVGTLDVQSNTISTSQTNEDLVLDANGTGTVQVDTDLVIRNQGDLRLLESTANGTNFIAMQAAANMAANYTLTWPSAVTGTNGFVLSSTTTGALSWVSAAGQVAVTDPGSVATVHYPLFGTNAGALPTTLDPRARTNLSFVPSTGELFSTIGVHPNIIGGGSASGTITIRGTSSGTKATASVLMTDGVASTTTATGTLVVTGGVGISGNINIGGNLSVSGSTTGIRNYTVQTTATTLADVDANYIVNNSGAITITLPLTSTNGRTIIIADGNNFQTNVVTIGRNTRNIAGVAEDLILNVRNSKIELVYLSGNWFTYVF